MSHPSLRGRIFLGSLLWTVGLFTAALVLSTLLMIRYRPVAVALHGAAYSHAAVFSVLALVCMVLGVVHVRRGLGAVERLRTRLADVRDGRERRVAGDYPSEVQPLVDDLNALLGHRERAVARALAKAGDLAHGLKTPLAVLAYESERAAASGHSQLAATISQQVERMRRQTEFHLAHARASASGGITEARPSVKDAARALSRTLLRLNAERGLQIEERVAASHRARCEAQDLEEMLGNLLDNACKWARTRVLIESRQDGSAIVITVDDDGPGLPAAMREAVLRRGVRADEAAPGSGLGLAIVRELAELYGGSVSLAGSPAGGLRAELRLPGQDG